MSVALGARVLKASEAATAEAVAVLRAGGLVVFPTETVYGLGADARSGSAAARIFEAKGRPRFNPLIVHVESLEAARRHADIPPLGETLARLFWPGPLTIVAPLRKAAGLSPLVTAGLDTVALRVPAQEAALGLLRRFGGPLAAPSANRSGRVSATTAAHAASDLGEAVDLIIDAGPCRAGLESTIVGVAGERPTLLRPGAVAARDIEATLGMPLLRAQAGAAPAAPGMLSSHYAPQARLRLDAQAPAPGEAYLAFGPGAPPHPHSLNLSPSGDLMEAAANFFAHLRALDALGLPVIAAAPVPETGLGEAINDRLRRAAAPREAA